MFILSIFLRAIDEKRIDCLPILPLPFRALFISAPHFRMDVKAFFSIRRKLVLAQFDSISVQAKLCTNSFSSLSSILATGGSPS